MTPPADDGAEVRRPEDIGTAALRTVVPFATAWIVAKLAQNGIEADVEQVNSLVVTVGGSLWYLVVRFLEAKWPALGWLIGNPKKPNYS